MAFYVFSVTKKKKCVPAAMHCVGSTRAVRAVKPMDSSLVVAECQHIDLDSKGSDIKN